MSSHAHPVHTFAELATWSIPGTGLGLLGQPVTHSLSPVIHNAALARLAGEDARFSSWRHYKFEIAPAELGRALALFHGRGFAGLNLTAPHKEPVLNHTEAADAFTQAAGAANTLIRTATGWRACNTDGLGLADALCSELGIGLRGTPVILLGAGGAARAAAVQCLRDHVASLWIGNRGRDRLNTLLEHLAPLAGGVPLHGFTIGQSPPGLPAGALVINATTLGLRGGDAPPIDLRQLPSPAQVYDMIYNPPVTALLKQAAALGLPHAHGLSMLVHQGARSLALWTGRRAPVDIMHAAARAALTSAA